MSTEQTLINRVKSRRIAKGWSQDELAARAGISRAGVSSIETNRLVPSTAAALALAAALDCRVEELFQLPSTNTDNASWAWLPNHEPCRFWRAIVRGKELIYPVEISNLGLVGHDGVLQDGRSEELPSSAPMDTLVLASCDPAVGLLAQELRRRHGLRLLAFQRSGQEALRLLEKGLVHVAGVHLSAAGRPGRNSLAAKEALQSRFCLLRGASWQEGLALGTGISNQSVHSVVESRARWVGRETGSAARELLDELLPARRAPRHVALGHRGVAEAIRCGWADVGVCLRLVSDEAGLGFIGLREEQYDLCFPDELDDDPRIKALVETVRSPEFRGMIGRLPGYDATETGALERVAFES